VERSQLNKSSDSFRNFLKTIGLSVSFYLVLGLLFILYLKSKGNPFILTDGLFLHFDALLYKKISDTGYSHEWLCAFFPAFPFIWNLLHLSAIGISMVNAILFLFAFSLLASIYRIRPLNQLFILSIPSFIFMFTPYSESLFFLFCCLFLIGLKENYPFLIYTGLFLASLVRPTAFVFIPAYIITSYLKNSSTRTSVRELITPVILILFGLFTTICVHYSFTEKWFVFFEAQKLWGNYLHLPSLPLKSWGGDASTRFDGSALFISIIAGIYLVTLFQKRLKNLLFRYEDVIFSLAYLAGTSLLIIAYRDGNLYSLNRFIYATPFVIISLHWFMKNYTFMWKHFWILLVVTQLFWLLFNSYNHIHNFLMFATVSIYFLILLLTRHSNKTVAFSSIFFLIIINCIGIIKLYYRFLNNGWVG
jgi:hypothetical protein